MNIKLKIKRINFDKLQWSVSCIDDVFYAQTVSEIFERIKEAKITNVIDGYFWHNMYIASQNLGTSDFIETNIYSEKDWRR